MKTALKAVGTLLVAAIAAVLIYTNWTTRGVSAVISRCEKLGLGMSREQVLRVMGDAAYSEKTGILKGRKVRAFVFEVPFTIDPVPQVTFDEADGKAQYIVCSERHRLKKD